MTWSTDFLARLKNNRHGLMFRFVVFDYTWAELFAASSSPSVTGDTWQITGPPDIAAHSISVPAWSYSPHTFSIGIHGTEAARTLAGAAARGMICRVYAGYSDWSTVKWQPIVSGYVRRLAYGADGGVVEAWGLLAGLHSRVNQASSGRRLFETAGNSTTLTADYTVGDSTISVTTISVFERPTGQAGFVTLGGFVLSYTGTSGSDLTGVSAAGDVGTTAADVTSGEVIGNVARIKATPGNIVTALLTSRVGGLGSLDIMPETWSWALDQRLVDNSNIAQIQGRYLSTTVSTHQWTLWSLLPVDSGITWLQNIANTAGVFVVQRQGTLTMRTARKQPTGATVTGTITDADIVSIGSWELWDPAAEAEYRRLSVVTTSGSTGFTASSIVTRPAAEVDTRDMTDWITSNESAARTTISNNMGHWSTTVGTVVSLILQGMEWTEFVPGDLLSVTSDALWTPDTASISGASSTKTLSERRALVTSSRPLWAEGTTEITLLIPPR